MAKKGADGLTDAQADAAWQFFTLMDASRQEHPDVFEKGDTLAI